MSEDDMCPNCVTPWKCNGPHGEVADDAEVMGVAGRAAERWAGTLRILDEAERTMTLTDFLLARIAEDEIVGHHLAQYGPRRAKRSTRMLAECEAKRRIVETATASREAGVYTAVPMVVGMANGLDVAISILATAYADHPDYRAEWRP